MIIENELKVEGHNAIKIKIKVPDLNMTILAMKAADGVFQQAGMGAGLLEAANNQLRLALLEIGGEKVTFESTAGEGLDKRLSHKQRDALSSALDRLVTPTAGEVDKAEAALSFGAVDGVIVYTATIPGRGAPFNTPAARVTFNLPSRNVERQAQLRAEQLEKRNRMIQVLHSTRERAALCLRQVELLAADGEVAATHKGEDGFHALAYWQQAALAHLMDTLATASATEVEGFLSGAVVS